MPAASRSLPQLLEVTLEDLAHRSAPLFDEFVDSGREGRPGCGAGTKQAPHVLGEGFATGRRLTVSTVISQAEGVPSC